MEIAVVVLTRERPAQLITCITALDTLSSGDNRISYVVRYDADDHATREIIELLPGERVVAVERPRPLTMGQAWNECLPHMAKALPQWEALSVMSDDVFPATPNWDKGVEIMIRDRGLSTFSWLEFNDQNNSNFPVMTRDWIEASGMIYPEWFPFWFSDTWVTQVYEFATGQPMTRVADMVLVGRRGKTAQMREFQWWLDFWNATLKLRAEEGENIRKKLGWPEVTTGPIMEKFERLGRSWNVPAIVEARQVQSDDDPPPERYLIAKRRAAAWLRENA